MVKLQDKEKQLLNTYFQKYSQRSKSATKRSWFSWNCMQGVTSSFFFVIGTFRGSLFGYCQVETALVFDATFLLWKLLVVGGICVVVWRLKFPEPRLRLSCPYAVSVLINYVFWLIGSVFVLSAYLVNTCAGMLIFPCICTGLDV
jgi:hypothetical protein